MKRNFVEENLFVEMDYLRLVAKDVIKNCIGNEIKNIGAVKDNLKRKIAKMKIRFYDKSVFYIGKSVIRLSFMNIFFNMNRYYVNGTKSFFYNYQVERLIMRLASRKIITSLKDLFPYYKIYYQDNNLHIYLTGERSEAYNKITGLLD